MTSFITQYKLLFLISWIICYLIFPSWALPISVTSRALVFFGLIIYFLISAFLMNRWFNTLTIDKPLIVKPTDWAKHIKSHLWLFIVCCIAMVLHIYPISYPILIIGDETIHLQNGLLIYEYIDSNRHLFFQIAFWVIIVLIVFIRKKKFADNIIKSIITRSHGSIKDNLLTCSFFFLIISFLVVYFISLKNISYSLTLIRYPPVSKFLYFLTYSAFGINHIFPRIIQLIFYLLCAIYLYRTINLFYEKHTALLGASIYLFLPVSFAYAYLGELESGTIFFIVAISFYFLRFIKDGNNRDIILSAYLIGLGFLYKDPALLVFPVCLIFLIFQKIRKKPLYSFVHLKILSLALLTVIPWMIITKLFSWRNYKFQLSNLTSLDAKIVTYLSLLSSNLSEVIFIMFIASAIYICFFKRNTLTIFFGLLFIVYYFFIVSDMGALSPRFSLAFYPTITVFLSLFISRIIQYIKWKHAFKLCTVVLTIYLIIICLVPPSNNRFLIIENNKLQYYPSEKAMKWVKENVKDGEKVLAIRILSSAFYRYKYAINRDKIIDLPHNMEEFNTPEKLKKFYREHNISYLMFPYSTAYIKLDITAGILEYLKNNTKKEFTEVVKFNLDDKFVFIYKLKDN